ncbi:hypothetical protein EVAR_48846_1 [Eumeta japonica]|uniref:Uncharacterized protein n=1 Tax=Eumeta variegata TaxID=151549 RepID=A0A4C1YDE0_EUMVA|nr:hypothetical protein EVAR_48846_1 [Eumeta japonica]
MIRNGVGQIFWPPERFPRALNSSRRGHKGRVADPKFHRAEPFSHRNVLLMRTDNIIIRVRRRNASPTRPVKLFYACCGDVPLQHQLRDCAPKINLI